MKLILQYSMVLAFVATALSCSSYSGSEVRFAMPGFQVLGGEVFVIEDQDTEGVTPGPAPTALSRFDLNIYRAGNVTATTIDLLAKVLECAVPCEVSLIVAPGENVVFDFQAYTGVGEEQKLERRGFAVTSVIEGEPLVVDGIMWPSVRYESAVSSESDFGAVAMDIVRANTAMWLVFDFNQQPFDASYSKESNRVGGKIEFDFSVLVGANKELGGDALSADQTVTHRMILSPSCERFLFGPNASTETTGDNRCSELQVPELGVPAQLPYQVFGTGIFVRVPYSVIGGHTYSLTELKQGSIVAGFRFSNGDWQLLPATGVAAIRP